jgi:hypothetical protein
MTITHATEDTPITIGQWVHGPSALEYGTHSTPRQVTDIRGKRIHYKRQDGTESFMLRSAVLIVCDTEAEANKVYGLSISRDRRISEDVRYLLREKGAVYDELLNQLIRGEAV